MDNGQTKFFTIVIVTTVIFFAVNRVWRRHHIPMAPTSEANIQGSANDEAPNITVMDKKNQDQNQNTTTAPAVKPSISDAPASATFTKPQAAAQISKPLAVNNQLPSAEVRQQFQSAVQSFQTSVPTVSELRGLSSKEAHFTPDSITNAGMTMGNLAELVGNHPELTPQALSVYAECVKSEKYPKSIRAVCLVDWQKMNFSQSANNPDFPGVDQLPRDVLRLAKALQQ